MGVLDWFKKKTLPSRNILTEMGGYQAVFTRFGTDIYASDIVRDSVRPLAEHTSKAEAKSNVERYANLLNGRPNLYMNGKDFLSKVRNNLELTNTAFIAIMRDNKGNATGFYPVPYSKFEALEYEKRLYIKFYFNSGKELVQAWDDLAALRKDYNKYDIAGDENTAVYKPLDLIETTNQGIGNAVKATANLRGILKSTKAMLSPESVKEQKEQFVRDYLNLENNGGIASLDATQEFTPISMNPVITSWEQQKEFRENIYRYFGVNDSIVMSDYTEQQMNAFYDARIEPFLVALSLELTNKVFTERERSFGNFIIYESNRIQFASTSTKLSLVALVDRGAMTPNEWRGVFNLAPIEGGDKPIRRLDTAEVNGDPVDENPKEEDEEGNDGSEG